MKSLLSYYESAVSKFEFLALTALQLLLIVTIAPSVFLLFVLFWNGLRMQVIQAETMEMLQPVLQKAFSGVLIVVLGLELLETLRTYVQEHHVRLEVILVVAIIAAGRRIIEMDFSHTEGLKLVGLGTLMTSLAVSYFLVKKTHGRLP